MSLIKRFLIVVAVDVAGLPGLNKSFRIAFECILYDFCGLEAVYDRIEHRHFLTLIGAFSIDLGDAVSDVFQYRIDDIVRMLGDDDDRFMRVAFMHVGDDIV